MCGGTWSNTATRGVYFGQKHHTRIRTTSIRRAFAPRQLIVSFAECPNRLDWDCCVALAGETVRRCDHALRGGALLSCSCALQICVSLAIHLVTGTRRETVSTISPTALLPVKDVLEKALVGRWQGKGIIPALVRFRFRKVSRVVVQRSTRSRLLCGGLSFHHTAAVGF